MHSSREEVDKHVRDVLENVNDEYEVINMMM